MKQQVIREAGGRESHASTRRPPRWILGLGAGREFGYVCVRWHRFDSGLALPVIFPCLRAEVTPVKLLSTEEAFVK